MWIKEGPGIGRAVAEWMTHGHSEIDVHHSDIARFYPHQRTREHVRSRTAEAFNKTYGIVHPSEQWDGERGKRLAPMHAAERDADAVFFETAGWERPMWYAAQRGAARRVRRRGACRASTSGTPAGGRPIINAEHLAMRERAGIIDLSAFAIFDVVGPGAQDAVQGIVVAQADVAEGRVIYTPVLDAKGGFRSDLTVMRLAHDHYRVVTGGAHGMADLKWFADHLPADGRASIVDLTSAYTTIGLWGPRARDILGSLTDDDVSDAGFGFLSCRDIAVGSTAVLASRISYVGELGWELYVPMEQGARLWRQLHEAGRPHGAVPVGIGVYGTTGRIEKGYRAFGFELDGERTIIEAGMARPKVKTADFVGRDAYVAQREAPPKAVLCTMTVDNHVSTSGLRRYMLGGEPILAAERRGLDRRARPSPVRHDRRVGAVAGQARAAGLPAAGPGRAGQPARGVLHGGAVPGDGRVGGRHPAVRPDQRADQGLIAVTNVLVCVKRVPDSSGEVLLTADAQAVDAQFVGFTVSPHESCAVELAVKIAEAGGGHGDRADPRARRRRRAAALRARRGLHGRRADRGRHWSGSARPTWPGRSPQWCPAHEAAGRGYDLILLGNDAADTGDFQVGIRLAYQLGRPVVNGIKTVEVADGVATLRGDGPDGGVETFRVPLPRWPPCWRAASSPATRRSPDG